VKVAGRPVLPVCVAWNPMSIEALGAIVALYDMLRAVTAPLVGE
jgi:hypothetical protein